nr:DUF5694 domain-containing protein [uncultured Allomuricauda sp.]
MKKTYLLFISLFIFCSIAKAQSDIDQTQSKPTIALLGTFHFAGSTDAMSLKTDDLDAPKRQKEIVALVQALSDYKPTKVILEYPYGAMGIDSTYQLYLSGSHTLTKNERQQIGFRLAAKMGHKNVYPADYRLDLPFDSLMTFLNKTNQIKLFEKLMSDMKVQVIDVWQNAYNKLTLKEFFAFLNSNKYDALNRNVYLEYINKMGSKDNYVGSKVVAKWWERNFKIMYHIDSLMEPGDRVLVLFGQGHTAILKDFYKNRSDIIYADILQYLKK